MDPRESADNTEDVSKRLQLVSNKLATSVDAGLLSEVTPVPTSAPTPGPATVPITAQPSEHDEETEPSQPEPPDVDFAAVISQIKLLLQANPPESEAVENRKIMRAIRRKFKSLLENQRDSVDEEKKQATMAIAEQIAMWVEAVVREADLLGSSSTLLTVKSDEVAEEDSRIWPVFKKKSQDVYEVTSQDSFYVVKNLKNQEEEEWEQWVNSALKTAEEWSYWISSTCAEAGEKGEQLSVEEDERKLTFEEFKAWRDAVGEEGIAKIRRAREVREGKERWIGSCPVEAKKEWGKPARPELTPNFVGPTCESDEDLRALAEMKAQQAATEAEEPAE